MVLGHAFEKTLHCDRGDEPRHLAAEAEVLAGAKAEMALRPAIDVVDIRVGKFPPVAIAGAERERHFVANVHSFPVQLGLAHEKVATFEPRLRQLVGYGVYNFLIGHINKHSPEELLLDGDERLGMVWDEV